MLKKLGKYELVQEVGRGAMGEVYQAHDPLIGRLVAIKTIRSSLVGDPKLLERFYQEARSAGTLQHPNIVTIYELGREDETAFIAMEFLDGESLDRMIGQSSSLTISQKVGLLVPVCRALDYAHKRGVIHRDIKPGNVMVAKDGRVKVVDFGIARLADHSHTQTNVLLGTLPYISPQMIRGERADERSDIWALGVLFYELLCGRRPFDGDNHATLMMNIVDENRQPVPIREIVPACPPALDSLVSHMLRKDAGQRIQTMEEALFEIEPLWRTLQEANLSELITSGEKFIQARDFYHARDALRAALQINGANERAKALLEQVNSELKNSQTNPQILDILDRGRNFLKEGRIQDAIAAGEAALRMDSSFGPAKEFVADVQSAADWSRRTQSGRTRSSELPSTEELTRTTEQIDRVPGFEPTSSRNNSLPGGSGASLRSEERPASLFRSTFMRATRVFQKRPAPFAVGALLVFLGVPGLLFSLWRTPSPKQIALRDEALQLEEQHNWPQALSTYETLAQSWGSLARDGNASAASLRKSIDQENALWKQARSLEASGNSSGAASVYQQIVTLHGDKESDAEAAAARLSASMTLARTSPARQSTGACHLLTSDLPRFLEMAEKNRANGLYADAEREYNSVLECDPTNAHARAGLLKTKEAKGEPKP